MSLHPCPSCARHVRSGTETCPFCKEAIPATPIAQLPARRVARMAFAVATTTAALACGKTTADNKPPPEPTNVPVALYGAPPEMMDAAVAAAYGAPAVLPTEDAGTDAGAKKKK